MSVTETPLGWLQEVRNNLAAATIEMADEVLTWELEIGGGMVRVSPEKAVIFTREQQRLSVEWLAKHLTEAVEMALEVWEATR